MAILPWVRVKCLASKTLGMVARQLPGDWQRQHGIRPVLLETYVDLERHKGTCHRAANWRFLGRTKGAAATARTRARTPKGVFAYPLQADWRTVLLEGPRKAAHQRRKAQPEPGPARPPEADERFVRMWQGILGTVTRVAREHDREWMRRQRLINTLLVVLFVYRLVFSHDDRGYGVTLNRLWEQCRRLGVQLPQPEPVSAAAMCVARAKVDEAVFRRIHWAVLAAAREPLAARPWQGHRAFAVDGSKLNLPRPLRRDGYRLPAPKAHYPQGLLSCLYQLGTRIPVDCELVAHRDERRAALNHLAALQPGDVVVYDRGYYSFWMLHCHLERGLHAVFRLKRNANAVFGEFIRGRRSEAVVTVRPSREARAQHPEAALRPCRVRLVQYTAGKSAYALATTLLERKRYPARALADLYHGRWAIEELYKISKERPAVEEFHGRRERAVKQEVYAHCTLIAMTRLFTNHSEAGLRAAPGEPMALT